METMTKESPMRGQVGEGRRPGGAAGFAVVIVNWNGWRDTIECLESVFRSDHLPETVVVCDNASSDGSVERIRDWAEGRLVPLLPPGHPLRPLINPAAEKSIPYVEYDRATAEGGGDPGDTGAPLILIHTGADLGYAGGTNVGIRYLLARGGESPIWLLNPDTVVEPAAGRELFRRLTSDAQIGMCGSNVRYHQHPHLNQALGGARHFWWLALPRHIGAGSPAGAGMDEDEVASRMSYVYGASMMVSRRFLREVGLFDEDYFLYFEELDLAMRGRGKGFSLGYASGSVVYHRGGGTPDGEGDRSMEADYYFLRNRLRVTRKFRPIALPGAYVALLIALLRRAGRGEWARMRMVAKLLIGA
jgi:GT2 family glycosyltransferase